MASTISHSVLHGFNSMGCTPRWPSRFFFAAKLHWGPWRNLQGGATIIIAFSGCVCVLWTMKYQYKIPPLRFNTPLMVPSMWENPWEKKTGFVWGRPGSRGRLGSFFAPPKASKRYTNRKTVPRSMVSWDWLKGKSSPETMFLPSKIGASWKIFPSIQFYDEYCRLWHMKKIWVKPCNEEIESNRSNRW